MADRGIRRFVLELKPGERALTEGLLVKHMAQLADAAGWQLAGAEVAPLPAGPPVLVSPTPSEKPGPSDQSPGPV